MIFNNNDRWLNFLMLVFFTIFFGYSFQELLNINQLFINSIGEQFTIDQIQNILDFQEKWAFLSFLFIPIFLLLKIFIISAIIDVGCFFYDKEIKFKVIFNVVIKAEFIFLLVILLKFIWFYFFQEDHTLQDIQQFYPLSALNIIGHQGLDPWWIYPLQTLNIFELAYWVVLAYFLSKEIKDTTDKGFAIVASSYGVSLLIWVIGVMFFILNVN
ncbi:hypothetical protein [Yeosuana sp.]|uniref:hypothetical protein n=1 Tax=Yeosuana sp. TaxID=2529388 RepID=UPI00404A71B5